LDLGGYFGEEGGKSKEKEREISPSIRGGKKDPIGVPISTPPVERRKGENRRKGSRKFSSIKRVASSTGGNPLKEGKNGVRGRNITKDDGRR